MSQTTKRALAQSLKHLMEQKPLEKITVVDISEDCGVNRQTFYYHFQDIYDLIEWIYINEAEKRLGEKTTYDTWQEGFLQILSYILNNRNFVRNTYHSVSREYLEHFLFQQMYRLLLGVIEDKAEDMAVRDADKQFIADFYKYAFVGLVCEWIENGMKEKPEAMTDRLSLLVHGTITGALERFRTDKKH